MAGKRVGPAEVESAAVAHPGGSRGGGYRRARPGQGRGRGGVLRAARRRPGRRGRGRRDRIARSLGKALKPERVIVVRELPKTRTGKIMRGVIRGAYLGGEPAISAHSRTRPAWTRFAPRAERLSAMASSAAGRRRDVGLLDAWMPAPGRWRRRDRQHFSRARRGALDGTAYRRQQVVDVERLRHDAVDIRQLRDR